MARVFTACSYLCLTVAGVVSVGLALGMVDWGEGEALRVGHLILVFWLLLPYAILAIFVRRHRGSGPLAAALLAMSVTVGVGGAWMFYGIYTATDALVGVWMFWFPALQLVVVVSTATICWGLGDAPARAGSAAAASQAPSEPAPPLTRIMPALVNVSYLTCSVAAVATIVLLTRTLRLPDRESIMWFTFLTGYLWCLLPYLVLGLLIYRCHRSSPFLLLFFAMTVVVSVGGLLYMYNLDVKPEQVNWRWMGIPFMQLVLIRLTAMSRWPRWWR